jgi:tetratricopeptide (TPR) repeat protein
MLQALPLLEDAVHAYEARGIRAYEALWLVALAEGYLLTSRPEDALRQASRALEVSLRHDERGHEAWALRLLGEIASHHHGLDVVTAEAHYGASMALASELAMRPLVAHCHLGLGKLYGRTGKRLEAQEHLTIATTMYREMDMRFWLEQTEAEIELLG